MSFGHPVDFISRRYDRLAPVYRALQIVLVEPPRIRLKAVARLQLGRGDTVLEIGCGTGLCLGLLVDAVGPTGTVMGVDASAGMLARARRLSEHRGWSNVDLIHQDAATVPLPDDLDAVLFSFCYSVLPRPRDILERAWRALRPGGRIVILDGAIPGGALGRLLSPVAIALSKTTVLGETREPWSDLAELGADVETERLQLGTYFICHAAKQRAGASNRIR